MLDPKPLSAKQREQLIALKQGGAVASSTARGPHDALAMCNPLVMGALRDRGMVASRTVRAGAGGTTRGQFTAYWLTAAGVSAAISAELEASAK